MDQAGLCPSMHTCPKGRGRTGRHDEVNPQTDEFVRESGEPIEPPFRPSALKSDVLSLHVAQLAQPLSEGLEIMGHGGAPAAREKTYPGDSHLLLRVGSGRRREEAKNEAKDQGGCCAPHVRPSQMHEHPRRPSVWPTRAQRGPRPRMRTHPAPPP